MSNKLGLKKQREHFMHDLTGEANDSWAAVELYRWQYGELPPPTGSKPTSVAAGLRGMATAFGSDSKKWPHPMNVASVLAYAAKLIEALESKNIQSTRHLNRLAAWAQQDPTGPLPEWRGAQVQSWVLNEIRAALGEDTTLQHWTPECLRPSGPLNPPRVGHSEVA